MHSNLDLVGRDVVVRGERATLRHLVHVPRTRDLFGTVLPAHYRGVVVYRDGSWRNDVLLRELQPIDA